ncbi:efflux RND transporter periplasmic adaptor subunit [Novipirellula maiorica]|uniref:efflux RND transporter periplasmic adaptor subunit n=1 Tax=Novipirellula maiorica TaxID=1265734 RepID=UPI0003458B16|nr:efflux RND transporter periplasmic adaptor subunit [Rhodopirellula maiorica]
MNHRLNRCFARVSVLGVLIGLAGCSPDPESVAKKNAAALRVTPVKTVAVAPTEVQRTTLQPASVHAYYRAELRAKISGFVRELKADIGDYVEAGAELATIDVPEMQKQREVIEARIQRLVAEEQRAQAGIDLASARVRASEAQLAEAKSKLSSAEASLAASSAEFNRTEDLVQRGSLQNRMLDEVRLKRDSELASKEAVTSSVQSAEAEVAVAQSQVASAKADRDAARAETEITRRQLDELDVLLSYAVIRAPFAGVITDRFVQPGDLVRESSEVGSGKPLFVLSQIDKVRVRIPVPESDASLVNPGDEVTLTFPSFTAEAPITASVTRRSGSLDPSTRTMMVEAEIANPDGKLLPGMFGQASIHLATKAAANMLPARAIRFEESGNAYVYVVGQDETVSIAPITMGMDDGNSIEVLSGVEAGQRVIDAHLSRFTNGQKVSVLAN